MRKGQRHSDEDELWAIQLVHADRTVATVNLPGINRYRRGIICENDVNKGGNTVKSVPDCQKWQLGTDFFVYQCFLIKNAAYSDNVFQEAFEYEWSNFFF